ncbi:MAG: PKD domain-containing protein [Alphaproteobacteria bacterium]|nr:PKD domain-containing protein [Alphaproteobacteria bacterium]
MSPLALGALLACTTPNPDRPDPVELVADAGPARTVPVGVAVKLDGSASTGAVEYLWDAGDGTTYATRAPTHIYTTPGNRTAVLRVTGEDGSTRTASIRVTVHPRLAEVPPATAGTLALDPEGRVWGLVKDANVLFTASADASVPIVACLDGSEPVGLTVLPRVSVLCGGDAPKLVHFPYGPNLVQEVPLPAHSRPSALLHRDGDWLVTLAATGQIARIRNDVEVTLTDVGPDPRSLVEGTDGPVAARFRSPADGGVLYGPDGVLPLPYDTGPDSDTGNRGVPNLLTLAASPDGDTVFVSGTLSNTARGTYRDGQDLTFETTVRAFVSAVDVPTGARRFRRQLDDQGHAGPMVASPLGNLLYVAFPATHTILVLDAFTGELTGSLLDVGRGVDGLLLSPDGGTLYVNAALDREIRAYDVTDLVVSPLLWSWPTVDVEPLAPDVLLGKRLFNDARDTRIAMSGYVSCSVCHPDGDHDGQVWDFTGRGEGLRNTTTLLGRAGTGMGPVHWTGNFDEIQDFEHDIRGPFQGTGLMTDAQFAQADTPLGPPKAGLSADLDALAAYVASLDQTPASPYPAPPGGDALFAASGCETCHPPPLFTDSALDVRHDVGTLTAASGQRLGGPLDGIDTPTLLGAWDTAPYLHDGSAATLEDAISAHVDAPADPAEVTLLADYVRSL